MKNIISPGLSPVFYLFSGKDDCSILCSVCALGYHCYGDGETLPVENNEKREALSGSDFYCCLGEQDKWCFQILSGG